MSARLLLPSLLAACQTDLAAATAPPPPAACTAGVAAVVDGTGHATIQAAVDAAARPAIIDVCPGTWTENVRVPRGEPLTLRGGATGAGRPVIDGGGLEAVISMEDTALTLIDLVIQNGVDDDGGGGVQAEGGAVIATRVDLLDNVAYEGGGVVLWAADGWFTDCVFRGNESTGGESGGGGLHLLGLNPGQRLRITGGAIEGNAALDGGSGGGLSVVSFDDAAIDLAGVRFAANAAVQGAAIWLHGEAGHTVATGADLLVRDHVGEPGAYGTIALFASDPTTQVDLDLTGGILGDNTADSGGALSLISLGAPLRARLTRTRVLRNTSAVPGGAVEAYGPAVIAFRRADLGAGALDNVGGDVAGCASALGARVSGVVAPDAGDPCP